MVDIDVNVLANSVQVESTSAATDSRKSDEEEISQLCKEDVSALEQLLSVGSVVDSVEIVYALYCDYGRLVGFSVKKGMQSYFTKHLCLGGRFFIVHERVYQMRHERSVLLPNIASPL